MLTGLEKYNIGMNQLLSLVCFILVFTIGFSACKKGDYFIDGGTHKAEVNMSTYDYLKTNKLFDTLILAIDRAGLKEAINGNVTFFAPTNYSFRNYVNLRLARLKKKDPYAVFTFNDISAKEFKDSLGMYIIDGKINRVDMNATGTVMEKNGENLVISLEEVNEYTEYGVKPKYVFFTRVVGKRRDLSTDTNLAADEQDIKVKCQTSGIITTGGILHVLENSHYFSFKRE